MPAHTRVLQGAPARPLASREPHLATGLSPTWLLHFHFDGAVRDPHRIRRYAPGRRGLEDLAVPAIACPGGRSAAWATFTNAAMSQCLLALIHDDSVAAHMLALLARRSRDGSRARRALATACSTVVWPPPTSSTGSRAARRRARPSPRSRPRPPSPFFPLPEGSQRPTGNWAR